MMRHPALLLFLFLAPLAACETLSHDGPAPRTVRAAAGAETYAVVDLDYRTTQLIAAHPPAVMQSLAPAASQARLDLIGEGDVLAVWIIQPGSGPTVGGRDAGAAERGGSIPQLTVAADGTVSPPYAGRVRVAGRTPAEAAEAIRQALRGRLVAPQVVVQVVTNLANSATVLGEVRNAGRYPLSAGGDRVLDVVAAAGGATRPVGDIAVTVVRGSRMVEAPLALLMASPAENIRLAPHDQVRLTYRPRRFSAFGAVGRASQVDIADDSLSLAGALARMGGLDAANADARGVMVFRFERPDVAEALGVAARPTSRGVPVIYRLNLRDPSGYFIAGSFEVRADDLIYAPRSDAAELRNFFGLVTSITQAAYDVRVSTVLP